MEKKKIILTTAVAVVVVAGGFWMLGGPEGKSTVDFATEAVTKGNVSNFITATGTIEPVTEVEVIRRYPVSLIRFMWITTPW